MNSLYSGIFVQLRSMYTLRIEFMNLYFFVFFPCFVFAAAKVEIIQLIIIVENRRESITVLHKNDKFTNVLFL